MPIAAPVAAWAMGAATAAGMTATTVAAVGAIAGSVAVGIVTGAVIGAATSVFTGGNIFEGALKGAVLGGITAGIGSGIGIATGLAPASAQLSAMGVSAAAPVSSAAPTSVGMTGAPFWESTASGLNPASAVGGASTFNVRPDLVPAAGTLATAPVPASNSLLYSELGKGLSKGIGDVASAKIKANSDAALAEQAKADAEAKIAGNVPGEFEARTANIKMPNWWEKYTAQAADIARYKPPTGLLGGAR